MKPYFSEDGIVIYHGDCRELIPQFSPDIVITDPPYGVRLDIDWDDMQPLEFNRFCMEWLAAVRKVCPELIGFFSGGSAFPRLCELIFERVRMLIWDKPLGSQYTGSSEKGFLFTYEPIAHCYPAEIEQQFVSAKDAIVGRLIKEGREHAGMSRSAVDIAIRGKKTGLCFRWEEGACLPTQPQAAELRRVLSLNGEFSSALLLAYAERDATVLRMRESARESAARERDVISCRTETGREHPCEKPEGLMRSIIRATTKTDQVILDPFSGSGTTLIAARTEGRRAIGIELEERYCEIAAKRLSQKVLNFDIGASHSQSGNEDGGSGPKALADGQ